MPELHRPLQHRIQAILPLGQQTANSFQHVSQLVWYLTAFLPIPIPPPGTPHEWESKSWLQSSCSSSPATGKLDWFDMIYPWQNHSLWGYCIPHARAMPSFGSNEQNSAPFELRDKTPTIQGVLLYHVQTPPSPQKQWKCHHSAAHFGKQGFISTENCRGIIRNITAGFELWTPRVPSGCGHTAPPQNSFPWDSSTEVGAGVIYTLKGAARRYKLLKHKLPKIHLKFTLNLAPEMQEIIKFSFSRSCVFKTCCV